jgi:hypothetical protein
MIVQSEFATEDAKTLVIYWDGEQYPEQKIGAKLLARARRTCSSYSTIASWKRTLKQGEDIQYKVCEVGR